jgi:hypothetical protein
MRNARRRLLACLPAALAPGAALAFRLEAPAAAVSAEYEGACPAVEAHEALRREIEGKLDGRPIPPALAPQLSALSRCPFCGCGVAGAPDHGERAPERG